MAPKEVKNTGEFRGFFKTMPKKTVSEETVTRQRWHPGNAKLREDLTGLSTEPQHFIRLQLQHRTKTRFAR